MADFDLATLGLEVRSDGVVVAANRLKDLESQGKKTESATSRMSKSFSGATAALVSMRSALAATGALGLAYFVQHNLNALDSLQDMAERLNISVEGLQKLQFAARQAGLSNDELQLSLQFLNRTIGDAVQNGGAARETFDKLGLSANALARMDLDDALGQIADRLLKVSDASQRATLYQELFSRSGQKMINLLSGGKVALEQWALAAASSGAIIPEEQVRRAAALSDRLDAVGFILQQRILTAVAEMEPMISSIVSQMESQEFQQGVQNFAEWIIKSVNALVDRFHDLMAIFDALRSAGEFLGVHAGVKAIEEAFVAAKNAVSATIQDLTSLENQISIVADIVDGLTPDTAPYEKMMTILQDLIEKKEQLDRTSAAQAGSGDTGQMFGPNLPTPQRQHGSGTSDLGLKDVQALERKAAATENLSHYIEQGVAVSREQEAVNQAMVWGIDKFGESVTRAHPLVERYVQALIRQAAADKRVAAERAYVDLRESVRDQEGLTEAIKAGAAAEHEYEITIATANYAREHELEMTDALVRGYRDLLEQKQRNADVQVHEHSMRDLNDQLEMLSAGRNTFDPVERAGVIAEKQKEIELRSKIGVLTKEQIDDEIKLAGVVARATEANNEWMELAGDLGKTISSGLEDAIMNADNLTDALGGVLKAIEQILIRATITKPLDNLITGLIGSFGGGGMTTIDPANIAWSTPMTAHGGGLVNWNGAPRYHTGGMAGLRPDERPIIAQVGEEILSRSDPRNRNNAGMSGTVVEINIINNTNANVSQKQSDKGNGQQRIDILIDDQVAQTIRPGTKTFSAIKNTFAGMSTPTVGR